MEFHDKPASQLLEPGPKRTLMLCLLLVACTVAIYNPIGHNGFVNYDDDVYITSNWHVQSGLHWSSLRWAFTSFDGANWHPLTWIAHILDCQLFRLNPAGHHYASLLLHCVNAILLFLLLAEASRRYWLSFAVAIIFALHPLNVESVAWAAERKTVLSMTFLLLALWAYQRYARQPSLSGYALVLLAYACGLMAKPQVIILPFLLLLWDYWPLRRLEFVASPDIANASSNYERVRPLWLVVEKLPLFALCAADALVTLKAQRAAGAVRSAIEYPFTVRLKNAICAYLEYLSKMFWPVRLAAMYPHPGDSLRWWHVIAACLFLFAMSTVVIALQKRIHSPRYLLVGWFWFLGALVPMIGLIQAGVQATADRYMYVAMIGLLIMLSWGLADWIGSRPTQQLGVITAVFLVLAALGALSYRQAGFWRNSETLWTHAVAVTKGNYIAHLNLGDTLLDEGRPDDAAPQFHAAARIRPDDPTVQLNVATFERRVGNFEPALEGDQAILRLTSDRALRALTFNNLGLDYRCLRDYVHARESYAAALSLQPDSARAFIGLGVIAQRTGDIAEAVRNFSRAVEVEPTDLEYLLLAQALEQTGEHAAAQAALEESRKRSSNFDLTQRAVFSVLSR